LLHLSDVSDTAFFINSSLLYLINFLYTKYKICEVAVSTPELFKWKKWYYLKS